MIEGVRIKVQCVSTKCGYYDELSLGKWYEAVMFDDKEYFMPNQPKVWKRYCYEKSLFRTVSERRNMKLNKLGI